MGDSVEILENRALELINSGAGEEAVKIYEAIGRSNHELYGASNYKIGSIYQNGKGVTPNLELALHFYEKAEQQGLKVASYSLGVVRQERKDYSKALEHFRSVADLNPSAAYWCYRILLNYPDLRSSENEELYYLDLACSLGHLVAKRAYARICLTGQRGLIDFLYGAMIYIRFPFELFFAIKNKKIFYFQ
ncbi:tetratricopeptide repeat protein [Rhizobium sp. TRM95796]|uniref:tetratricopeptide repeat protein n=1 Tax=Rhizobium sp. TRM95796 TaxID=2979862 RepID=UPI0021E77580|nr:tetratricopeptide repeat protein [Rhizobium sp. TRM95796]MCV3766935.1 sel1 repeat family protein [Rhizobium sp. TRM95796]